MPARGDYKLTKEDIAATIHMSTKEAAVFLNVGFATISRNRKRWGFKKKTGRDKLLVMKDVNCKMCNVVFQTELVQRIFCSKVCYQQHRSEFPRDLTDSQKEVISTKAKIRWQTPTENMISGIEKRKSKLDLSQFRKYRSRVKILTEKIYQEYVDFINPERYLRAIAGTEGGYHLDHKISVKRGFVENIPAEEIAALSNLQMLPWRENISKGG